jgi:DNA polymerase-3 subunit beta
MKEDVLEGVQKASSIIPAKTGAAFLRTIWLEAREGTLSVMSTDSKLEFSGRYPASVEEEGLIGVHGRNYFELMRKLPPGELEFHAEEGSSSLLIKQGKRKYKLPTYDPSWFQNFSPFPEENAIQWSGDFLRELIEHISFCIADDNTDQMYYMKISPLEDSKTIEVCGLNGHQFAMQRFEHQDMFALLGEEGFLIAKPYLLELRKWLPNEELRFTVNDKRLFFTNHKQNEIFSLPVSYDRFPKYELFLTYFENETSTMALDKDELLESLERLSIFNTETQRCSYFVFDDQELVIYSQGQDTGEATESIPMDFQGHLDKIVFPTKNLIEVLHHFESDLIRFEFTKNDGPCKVSGDEDPGYVVVIMPVEIKEETYYTDEVVEEEEL